MDLSHSSGRALGKAITGVDERRSDPMDVLKQETMRPDTADDHRKRTLQDDILADRDSSSHSDEEHARPTRGGAGRASAPQASGSRPVGNPRPSGSSRYSAKHLFAMFDEDGSGQIEFDEFKQMLPLLGLHLDTAKALKYFRLVDTDNSGAISLKELKEAMFIIDPSMGNPIGFKPSSRLGPEDAFALFDKDNSGGLDEDEFVFALEYLGYKFDLEDEDLIEKMFRKYDADQSGVIDSIEFRKMWLDLCDAKAELAARGISNLPERLPRRTLQTMLEELIVEEKRLEIESLRQAQVWIKWRAVLQTRRRLLRRARRRALRELGRAMDQAGQVILFGSGTRGAFQGLVPVSPVPTRHYRDLYRVWTQKLRPGNLSPRAGAAFLANIEGYAGPASIVPKPGSAAATEPGRAIGRRLPGIPAGSVPGASGASA